jgi:hypothetical protein
MTPGYLEFPNLYLPLLFNLLIFTITYLITLCLVYVIFLMHVIVITVIN